jgi:hypothetical protein
LAVYYCWEYVKEILAREIKRKKRGVGRERERGGERGLAATA